MSILHTFGYRPTSHRKLLPDKHVQVLKCSIFNVLMSAGLYIRQLASSLPSLQSGSPSHLHFLWIHSPERHCISLDEHLAGGVGWRPQRDGDSSDWSCRGQRPEKWGFDHASPEKLQGSVIALRFLATCNSKDNTIISMRMPVLFQCFSQHSVCESFSICCSLAVINTCSLVAISWQGACNLT